MSFLGACSRAYPRRETALSQLVKGGRVLTLLLRLDVTWIDRGVKKVWKNFWRAAEKFESRHEF